MEAFGDTIVFGKAPHAGDLFLPAFERLAEGDQRTQAGVGDLADHPQQAWCQLPALAYHLVALSHQWADAVHLLVDG